MEFRCRKGNFRSAFCVVPLKRGTAGGGAPRMEEEVVMQFRDRREAGKILAEKLSRLQDEGRLPDPVVLALPRGGLPVADEIARELGAPLDVVVARKIGAPFQPELGVGAVAGDAPPVYDPVILRQLGLSEHDLAQTVEREKAELKRREQAYRKGRGPLELEGRSAVLVDDGIATGSTARAALRALRQAGPVRTVLAAPVCSKEAMEQLAGEADEIVCAYVPPAFGAVGFWYASFPQLSDDEVLDILHVSR